jgi:long-chain fatty acid transport protein
MKKIVTSLAVALAATSAFAGGLLTTTNQNAHSLRFFSQEADINLSSLYANPAGSAFLNKGWHISASTMTAMQTRTIAATSQLYAMNANNRSTTHTFEGETFAPVIPSFDFAYVQDKWSVSARFGVVAGGGKIRLCS